MDMNTWEDACKLQSEMNSDRDLLMWEVYVNTSDFPGRFTARPQSMFAMKHGIALDFVLVSDSLDGIRKMLPPGLVKMGRDPDDEPQIVEVWI
jgi:hypothetical protein